MNNGFNRRLFIFLQLLMMAGCGNENADTQAVLRTYTDIAYAAYDDSYRSALKLQKAVDEFLQAPDPVSHEKAKQAWLQARNPYGQTEVFRFGNANVDAWEGNVNSWPLDEGLIDYVADSYEYEEGNPHAAANIIAGAEPITIELLRDYQEKDGAEANVATGYHAIEFLLWGQDFNRQTSDQGLRPYTDYALGEACSNNHCERRRAYLKTVTDLLVSDLKQMADDWAPERDNYRSKFLQNKPADGLRIMFFGMGSLSLGELAGERMNVALLSGSQEDEHSCFSDNTHMDIQNNAQGIRNVYLGEYRRLDGVMVSGPSLSTLVQKRSPDMDNKLRRQLDETAEKVFAIVQTARSGTAFDQQILPENTMLYAGVKAAIDALRAQTETLEMAARLAGVENLTAQGSDSFNN
ncbi:MAG TPA: imelysin family protein [Gammaproteobacteria bacterium]